MICHNRHVTTTWENGKLDLMMYGKLAQILRLKCFKILQINPLGDEENMLEELGQYRGY